MPVNIATIKRYFLCGFIASSILTPCAHAELNKWVDEKGQIHYGDRVPSEYLRKEHSQLNEQGVTLSTSKAIKTDQELSEEQLKQKIENEKKTRRMIAARKQALRDRVLLDTFTTENDLILARDARIEAIDSQISLAEALIKNDAKRLANAEQRIAAIEKSGREVPKNLHKEVSSVKRQLENNYTFIKDKNTERKDILETFEQDVIRFRALKKARKEAREKHQ